MRWQKRGHIYAPDGSRRWARKYASFPTVEVLDGVLRVYFTALDEHNYGRTSYVELDPGDPSLVLYEAPEPVLDIGEIGAFDDCGATAFSIARAGSSRYLYYQGWQRSERVPYLLFTGVAIDDGKGQGFHKHSRTPILDRTDADPFIRGSPYVLKHGDGFHMWYTSGRRWVRDEHGVHYEIVIRHATSRDGLGWVADEEPAVSIDSDEYAVGRPSVLLDGETYRMWYSIRSFSQPYRIGYAESSDGIHWTRRDSEARIDRSPTGWDSAMICYPNVVRVDDRLLMFYNGNQHGASGFGYAVAAQ